MNARLPSPFACHHRSTPYPYPENVRQVAAQRRAGFIDDHRQGDLGRRPSLGPGPELGLVVLVLFWLYQDGVDEIGKRSDRHQPHSAGVEVMPSQFDFLARPLDAQAVDLHLRLSGPDACGAQGAYAMLDVRRWSLREGL